MKTLRIIPILLVAAVMATSAFSCSTDDDDYGNVSATPINTPNAVVTLKTMHGHLYMQLDDSTLLYPTNLLTNPYGDKEIRALVNIVKFKSEDATDVYSNATQVYVHWMDSILTKPIAPSLGAEDDATYGNDPLEIVDDWTTVCEDGYLTLRFRTYFGFEVQHSVNLVRGTEPYEVVLHHNAYGDLDGAVSDGIVAFRLDSLPDTNGKTEELTLKWNSFNGEKSAKFKYKTRKE